MEIIELVMNYILYSDYLFHRSIRETMKILHKNFIDRYNWNCSSKEFSDWIEENDILVSAVHDGSDGWVFVNEEDLIAFKLKFKQIRFRKEEIDTAYFFCPYIPVMVWNPVIPPSDPTI
jgi:hypothetical protein